MLTNNRKIISFYWKDFYYIALLSFVVSSLLVFTLRNWFGINVNFVPGNDMIAYLNNANRIFDWAWPGSKPFFRAPLYSYILAGMILIGRNLIGVQLLQCLIFSISNGVILVTTQLLHDRVSGWIASIILLLYGAGVFWVLILHSTVFELFFSATTLLFFVLMRISLLNQKSRLKTHFAKTILFAISFGLLCLIRPNFFISGIFLLAIILIEAYKTKKLKIANISTLCVILVCLSLWLPFGIHNYKYSSSPFTTNAKYTFKTANNEDSKAYNSMKLSNKILSPTSVKFWKHQLKKSIAYLKSTEYPQNVCYYLFQEHSLILKLMFIPFGLIVAIFFIGIIICGKQFINLCPCYAFFFTYYVSVCLFHIIGRFRIPGLPPMLIVSSIALVTLHREAKRKHFVKVAIYASFILILFFVSNPFHKTVKGYSNRGFGVAALIAGEFKVADTFFMKNNNNLLNLELLVCSCIMQNKLNRANSILNYLIQMSKDKDQYMLTGKTLSILGAEHVRINDNVFNNKISVVHYDRIYAFLQFFNKLFKGETYSKSNLLIHTPYHKYSH